MPEANYTLKLTLAEASLIRDALQGVLDKAELEITGAPDPERWGPATEEARERYTRAEALLRRL